MASPARADAIQFGLLKSINRPNRSNQVSVRYLAPRASTRKPGARFPKRTRDGSARCLFPARSTAARHSARQRPRRHLLRRRRLRALPPLARRSGRRLWLPNPRLRADDQPHAPPGDAATRGQPAAHHAVAGTTPTRAMSTPPTGGAASSGRAAIARHQSTARPTSSLLPLYRAQSGARRSRPPALASKSASQNRGPPPPGVAASGRRMPPRAAHRALFLPDWRAGPITDRFAKAPQK